MQFDLGDDFFVIVFVGDVDYLYVGYCWVSEEEFFQFVWIDVFVVVDDYVFVVFDDLYVVVVVYYCQVVGVYLVCWVDGFGGGLGVVLVVEYYVVVVGVQFVDFVVWYYFVCLVDDFVFQFWLGVFDSGYVQFQVIVWIGLQ